MFSPIVLLLATPAQPMMECQKDETGECVTISPKSKLARIDGNAAREIYAPYFDCYYSAMVDQQDFGSNDPQLADAVVKVANQSCASKRVSADNKMDALLARQSYYGDEQNRASVREDFRQTFGLQWLAIRAMGDKRAKELTQTFQAASQARGERGD